MTRHNTNPKRIPAYFDVTERGKKRIITVNIPVWLLVLIDKLVESGTFISRSELLRYVLVEGLHRYFKMSREMVLSLVPASMEVNSLAQKEVSALQEILESNDVDRKLNMEDMAALFPDTYRKITERVKQ